jgi:hypothetical protein
MALITQMNTIKYELILPSSKKYKPQITRINTDFSPYKIYRLPNNIVPLFRCKIIPSSNTFCPLSQVCFTTP